jgi:hypothetical protein
MNSESNLQETLIRLINVLGPETFNRLVASVPATQQKGRLRFWQEQLLDQFANETGIEISTLEQFLRVFNDAQLQELPREKITKEVFLNQMAAFPYCGFDLAEIPPDWMAEAWQIDRVREGLSYSFARDVSKTGSLCRTDEYLEFLNRSLTIEQQVNLFHYIMATCSSREAEFRPEFERAFPKCVDSLPPPLPQSDTEDLGYNENGPPYPIDGEVPF